jgi:hypothetical protein
MIGPCKGNREERLMFGFCDYRSSTGDHMENQKTYVEKMQAVDPMMKQVRGQEVNVYIVYFRMGQAVLLILVHFYYYFRNLL